MGAISFPPHDISDRQRSGWRY